MPRISPTVSLPRPQRAIALRGLDPAHLSKLEGSGLTADTIIRAGIYTERDVGRLRLLLRGSNLAQAPALVLPGFGPDGTRAGYGVARLTRPVRRPDGRRVKYLMPTGLASRAYFPPLPAVREALVTPGGLLVITEGILKALAAAQAGVACVGLMGVWNWVVAGSDPRELIPDLAGIDWAGRVVLILFDFDPERKPTVNHAAAELSRVLTECGADARVPHLPPGPYRPDARREKQGLDDFIVRVGPEEFARWVRRQAAEPAVRTLEQYRKAMGAARRAPGGLEVRLDRSPTGTGKSRAEAIALRRREEERDMERAAGHTGSQRVSLTLVPTHANCHEAVAEYGGLGLEAAAFPQLTSASCIRYDEATAVLARGLPFTEVLCPDCRHRDVCPYREATKAAFDAPHAVATHARGVTAMAELARGRTRITVHESPLGMLRPTFVTLRGLAVVALVAQEAERVTAPPEDRAFFRYLARVAKDLDGWLLGTTGTTGVTTGAVEVPLPTPAGHVPRQAFRTLYDATRTLGLSLDEGKALPPEAMRLALGAVLGELSLIAVAVDERPGPGGEVRLVRTLVGVKKTDLPPTAVVWINDATATAAELRAALGRPVTDVTPTGRLLPHHPVLQVPRDVTRQRDPGAVADLLRGILYDLPYKRVGLVTHKPLADKLPDLVGEPYGDRLVLVDYFGSGLSRGTNRWPRECDALVVLGTPRVGTGAIREHLLRLGKVRAAGRTREEAGWGLDYWSGVTESGRRVTVRTPHYRDHDWHAAYNSLVRSELVQAVGRGRGLLPDGIPVYVITTENLAPPDDEDGRNGVPVADAPFAPLTDAQARVLARLFRDKGGRRQRVVGKVPDMARALGLSVQRVRELLGELSVAGRVRKAWERGGWYARV